jgi:beta-glucanase (GH16 family)
LKTERFVGGAFVLAGLLSVACSSGSTAESPNAAAGSTAGGGAASGGAASGGTSAGGASTAAGAAGAAGALQASAGASGSSAGTAGGTAGGASGSAGRGGTSTTDSTDPTDLTKWTLVWSDEFNAADGSPPDPTKWTREENGSPANHELEYYTTDDANSTQMGGNLVITALKQSKGNQAYTSARLNTLNHYSVPYGRVEARAKMPAGQGIWPAFWMLGDNKFNAGVGWPKCGEIDIMETIGTDIQTNHGSLHGPTTGGSNYTITGTVQLPNKPSLADGFHVYATEWAMGSVKFFIDDQLYETRTPADLSATQEWAYDHPFFITVNLAIGGDFPGSPNATTPFPSVLLVDYVRVFAPK